ncbi:hypothetical protein RhiirA4_486712 [Rhizophagus irregularis]|uniref:Uncharacterized protein n=1 Tax=Rhizophagus irregularis TaxID=588596 RepID=A0A2I1HRS9_9GLOM|nr:hypothetical protein RhiirA4_480912 [Rhizophagus irregularis]PKY61567.1 hypothetical protein RhiirA4_486712 [Rhizophagus irregularis]
MQQQEDVYVFTKGCTSIDQLTFSINYSNDGFRMSFFYDPTDDHQIYHITCKEIKSEKSTDIDQRSEHTFGIELKQVEVQEQECLKFSITQRNNLENHLRAYLFILD